MPNGIRPMKIQRPRTPLIDAVAAHDKKKLKKTLFPKEEEKGQGIKLFCLDLFLPFIFLHNLTVLLKI
ncbi:hypothetical protein HanPSC8_Chr05g0208521 [Helianthus annuus]|nr:hypothetical protein HanPSC8_Chr09g0366941 [Helianthus annuus]KAJ0922842.1 hypothetical protein HanPSC8_Chr05g0208521 [Helianthus annuus]